MHNFFTHIHEQAARLFDLVIAPPRELSAARDLTIDTIFERCPRSSFRIGNIRAILNYRAGSTHSLIALLKFRNSGFARQLCAELLYRELNAMFPTQEIILIPVPSSKKRIRGKGFNHCERLLHELEKVDTEHRSEHHSKNRFEIQTDWIIKTRHTKRQALLTRSERLTNLRGVFAINPRGQTESAQNKIVVVIDDIVTTGTTMREVMRVAKSAGASEVHGLALAH